MDLAQPQLLWLCLLAPLAAVAAWWLWRRRLRADAAWAGRGLWSRLLPGYAPRRVQTGTVLLTIATIATATALARPRWGQSEEKVERRGVDIAFVLDSSLSMAAPDAAPSRFAVAEQLLRRLAQALPGNRVALVEAEGQGVVMAPLTTDAAVLDLLLDTASPASLPVPGTVLAPALLQAAKLFPDGGEKHRVIVLLSDGEDFGGGLEQAVAQLKEQGIVLHAIGIGTAQGSPIPIPGGAPGDLKRDADGKVVVSKLEEAALRALSAATGGLYVHATSAAYDPAPLVDRIQSMAGRKLQEDTLTLLEERFQWPLALGAFCILAILVARPFRETSA